MSEQRLLEIDAATGWSIGLWLVFGLSPVLLTNLPWSSWYTDPVLPAWIQAIGSVFAILATVFVVGLQKHLETRERRRTAHIDELRAVEGLRRVIKGAINICLKAARALDERSGDSMDITRIAIVAELTGAQLALESIQSHSLSDWRHTEAALTSRSSIAYLVEVLDRFGDQLAVLGDARRMALECTDQVGSVLQQRLGLLSDYLIQQGTVLELP